MMRLQFYLRFHTRYGQDLWITGDIPELGSNDHRKAIPMVFANEEFWSCTLDLKRKELPKTISYKYILRDDSGETMEEWGHDRLVEGFKKGVEEVQLVDTWNHPGEYENVFLSTAFTDVLLRTSKPGYKHGSDKHYSHVFKVKAPLLKKNEAVCLGGNGDRLDNWSTGKPVLLKKKNDWWEVKLDLSGNSFPLAYKYGIYNSKEKTFTRFEDGHNRLLYSDPSKKKITILHDGFLHGPNNDWKAAGIAIPVFSLRTNNGFGTGEFADIALLVDWAKAAGLKLVQLLPVNDTMASFTRADSYPYSAISAFALHPLYINLEKTAGNEYADQLDSLRRKKQQLNELPAVDYEEVMKFKISVLKELYEVMGEDCLGSADFLKFYEENNTWLLPYAAFCYFRDKNANANFEDWDSNIFYEKEEIDKISAPASPAAREIGFYYFVQYHLHTQLKEATDYARKQGIVLKGDIPIGISRHSCDAWIAPEMYNMYWQAGAPPDDFTPIGQNWGFPTYNWNRMRRDGFSWWKQRLTQMSNYFDAFRIDHILGFFRIWSIPLHAVQGLMGRFVPAIPVHINEFAEKGIWFDHQRYCRPFIIDEVLEELFAEQAAYVKEHFLVANEFGGYDLQTAFETQQQVQDHFVLLESTEENEQFKLGLFALIANVILFEEEGSQGQEFHFRIAMDKTLSYAHLIPHVQDKLKALYNDYYYHRQEDSWYKEAISKLPALKAASNMLVCGEDLGMVPHCVPAVMKETGILSLEIQRMPKEPGKEFFHPADAPYLSVVMPSTHDMSTLRGWWEENPALTQRFFNQVLEQPAEAPEHCDPVICKAIILQHLYSPAMWSIFQLQDILGMNERLRRENPDEERINDPADPNNYWQYRMYISLEELLREQAFNDELKEYVKQSGRG